MEIEDQVCTLEQMEELEKLGFNTEEASAVWTNCDQYERCPWTLASRSFDAKTWLKKQPTFTVTDMLEMLPEAVIVRGSDCILDIWKEDCVWSIAYRFFVYNAYQVSAVSLRDALVAELKILKENKEI